jgi:uncharacterized protein (UPF0335 family)
MTSNSQHGQIKAFVERLNRLAQDADAVRADVTDLKREIKGVGLNPKMVVKLAKMVRQDASAVKAELDEFEMYLAVYDFLN